MKLQELLARVPDARLHGDPNLLLTGLAYHSERVSPGQIFFAIRGWPGFWA